MIPEELKKLPQWCVSAGPDDKAPRNPRTGQLASVRDPSTWGTYEEAVASGYPLIGFVLTKDDPYFVIDLDAPATPEQSERHKRVFDAAQTYAELSQSGKGAHIVGKGSVPSGCRRDKIELYSRERYMIMTGRVVKMLPLNDCQELLDILYAEMSFSHGDVDYELEDHDEVISDADLVEMASNAVNGEKFDMLCAGDWEGTYPSQSEADYALVNILAFYTRSNEQVMRIFRMTALGKREKAWRDEYILRMLRKIRSGEVPMVDFTALLNGNGHHAESNGSGTHGGGSDSTRHLPVPALDSALLNEVLSPTPEDTPAHETEARRVPESTPPRSRSNSGGAPRSDTRSKHGGPNRAAAFPPGFVGDVAKYIYETSSRPVAEIATAASLALIAGIVGRQYNVSATGLNLYLIVLAKTGVGKEEATRGIDRIINALRPTIPVVDQFIGPGTFASGPAVIRTLDERPCFVSILGEFGLTLQALSDVNASPHSIILRRVLLDVYGKSGRHSVLPSSAYADKEKNTKSVFSPALTLFGESTPETFYGGLSLSMVADGLIPRFLITEYQGDRPERNRQPYAPPPEWIVSRVGDLVSTVLAMQGNSSWYDVGFTEDGKSQLDQFDTFCDAHIRAGESEGIRQLWNRTHLTALKLAGVLAVANNPQEPVITSEEARWAIDHATESAERIAGRFEEGDVGESEQKQNVDIRRLLERYVYGSYEDVKKYGVPRELHEARVVPATYLSRTTAGLAAFRKHKLGAGAALREAIRELLEADLIAEVPKKQMQEKFGTGARSFIVKF